MSSIRVWLLFFWCAVCLFALGVCHVTLAEVMPCTGKLINPLTDICWDCLLPITIGSSTVKSGSNPDTANPNSAFCQCPPGNILGEGIAVGYWEPMALVDVTRTPFCLVSLGGISLAEDPNTGDMTVADTRENSSFFHVHEYNFPIMQWLGVLSENCHAKG